MKSPIGMSVPGMSDLGYTAALGDQVAGETEDERRKRLISAQQNKLLPNATAGASSLGLGSTGYSVAGGLGG